MVLTHIAVQIVPGGVKRLKILNKSLAEARGIKIVRCGDCYSEHRGPRSKFFSAMQMAEAIVKNHSSEVAKIEEIDEEKLIIEQKHEERMAKKKDKKK